MAADRAKVHARIAGGRTADQVVDLHAVRPGQRQQQLQRRPALAALGSAGRLWSGQPNPQLVAQASDLESGEALDAGSGEGADAIWLARHGWTVTAVDVSTVALDRAAGYAAAAGDEIAGRITWQQQDLRSWDPGP